MPTPSTLYFTQIRAGAERTRTISQLKGPKTIVDKEKPQMPKDSASFGSILMLFTG